MRTQFQITKTSLIVDQEYIKLEYTFSQLQKYNILRQQFDSPCLATTCFAGWQWALPSDAFWL